VIFDNTPFNGSPGVLLAVLEGRDARELGRSSEAERREAVTGGLARIFGPEAAKPSGYVEKDWSAEPYSRGCYAGVLGPGAWTAYGTWLRDPIDRIHWAGTETATRWMGYFDGAVQSGKRAAAEVLRTEGAALATSAGARAAQASRVVPG
jgi:monoamine oxidase